MNLEDLRTVQDEERRSDSLQSLRDSFYQDVAEYVADLREERDRAAERADDPFGSEEVRRLTDEIETAEEVAQAIYERRVGKVVKRASLAAAGMATDEEGLTSEETRLFHDLVDLIETNRDAVLDVVSGSIPDEPPTADPTTDPNHDAPGSERVGESGAESTPQGNEARDHDPGNVGPEQETPSMAASDAMAGGSGAPSDSNSEPDPDPEPATESTADAEPIRPGGEEDGARSEREATTDEAGDGRGKSERVRLRITQDVGEIYGMDERVYDLAAEDVVTLPSENAEPLLEQDAAERF